MKTKFKRVLSIFLILCLTLTMMPGLAMVSLAHEETFGEYTLSVDFPEHCQDLLPNGSELYVTTSVMRTYDNDSGRSFVESISDYRVEAELIMLGGADADVLTCEVSENDKDLVFTSNNKGKTGGAEVVVSFYVGGECVGTINSQVSVMNTVWYWMDDLPGKNEVYLDTPEIGDVIDFTGFAVREEKYDYDSGQVIGRTIDVNTPNVKFTMEYDGECFVPEDDSNTSGLHSIERVGTFGSDVYIEFEETIEFGTTTVGVSYNVENLDYQVFFENDYVFAYDTETLKEINLDARSLQNKLDAKVNVEIGYINDGTGEFVALPDQSDLFTLGKSDIFVVVKANPEKIEAVKPNDNQTIINVSVTSNGYEVWNTQGAFEIKEAVELFDLNIPQKMVVGDTNSTFMQFEVYVENPEFPEGHFLYLDITDVEILSGDGDVITLDREDNLLEINAEGEGTAEIKFTYEKLDGTSGEIVKRFSVFKELYDINLIIETPNQNMLVPGGLDEVVDITVNKRSEEGDESVADVDYEWVVTDSNFAPYITFEEDPEDSGRFTIGAKADIPFEGDGSIWLDAFCYAYMVDEEGNRVVDDNGEYIIVEEVEHTLEVTRDAYYIELEGFDEYMEVGEYLVVVPKLIHAYVAENGQFKNETVLPTDLEMQYNEDLLSVTENFGGGYTFKRTAEYDAEIYVAAVYDEVSYGRNYVLRPLDYNVELFSNPRYILEGENTVVSIDGEDIHKMDYVTFQWDVVCQGNRECIILEENDGYTVSEDGKSIILDGTKIKEIGAHSVDITVHVYSGISDDLYEVGTHGTSLDVYAEGDELPPGEPDELTCEEFLGLADENGNIKLSNNIILKDPIVIADGKAYTVDLYGCEIYAPEQLDDGVIVTNGTIEFTSSKTYIPEEGSDEEYTANGVVCADATNTIVIDGPIGQANVILDETMIVSGANPIVVKSGTLKSAAYINIWENEDIPSLNDGLTVVDKNKVDITLTGGSYNYDVSEYLADTHTFVIEAYVNGETGNLEVYYNIIEKGLSPLELMVERYVFFVDKDGNYYRAQEVADLLGVEVERIGYWAEIVYTDVNGEFNNDEVDYKYIHAQVGMTVKEAYEWYMDEELEERPIDGAHFVGWFHIEDQEDIYWGDPLVDEDGDYVEDENGNMLWSKGNVINYGTDKIDINAPITKDLTIVTKWCDSTETKVVGKTEPTYLLSGYTGDTVCTECGTLIQKGESIEKLVPPVEDGKVEVSEEVLDDAIAESVTQDSEEVVIPLGDATEEVKEVQLPVASVETIVESGKDLTVETPEATVTLDNKALAAVTGNAEGETIVLQVEAIDETELNEEQQKAVEKFEVEKVISAEIICAETSEVISKDFEGGKATIKLPFVPAEGENVADYKIAYIADDGTVTIIDTTYADGCLVFEIEHFSEYAIVKEKTVIENPFTDLDEEWYYYDAVLWAVDKGITTGTSTTTFGPEEDCTRAQVVTFLWRAAGKPTANVANPFTDLDPNQYYYEAVLWAVEKGITTGTSATTFEPDATVTREQFVTLLWRMLGKPAATVNNPFTDVEAGQYYTDAVLWAYENGVTTGASATTFEPTANCLRSQVVTFIYRALK